MEWEVGSRGRRFVRPRSRIVAGPIEIEPETACTARASSEMKDQSIPCGRSWPRGTRIAVFAALVVGCQPPRATPPLDQGATPPGQEAVAHERREPDDRATEKAEDARVTAEAKLEEGKRAFERWEASGRRDASELEAAYRAFRSCLDAARLPACSANLASVCFHLRRYPEVARYAEDAAFQLEGGGLPFPEAPTAEDRARIAALRELSTEAARRAGAVRLKCNHRTELVVDGAFVTFCRSPIAAPYELYVEPGPHTIEIRHAKYGHRKFDIVAEAGSVQDVPWP